MEIVFLCNGENDQETIQFAIACGGDVIVFHQGSNRGR